MVLRFLKVLFLVSLKSSPNSEISVEMTEEGVDLLVSSEQVAGI